MNLVPLAEALKIEGMDRAIGTGPGRAEVLGIRPEHVAIVEGSGDGRPFADVTLSAIERVGAETYLYGALPSGGPDIALRTAGHVRKDLGETVRIGFDRRRFTASRPRRGGVLPKLWAASADSLNLPHSSYSHM